MKTTIVAPTLAHLLAARNEFTAAGCELEFIPCQGERSLVEACRDSFGIICGSEPLTPAVMAELRKCRVISRHGIGVDSIDLPAATEAGIVVANVPDYGLEEVADHAFALLLAVARRICAFAEAMRRGEWPAAEAEPMTRLRGRKLGLVGFGRIARLVAERAKPFGLKVSAFDPFASPDEARARQVELVPFDALCASADFISIHAPLTDATRRSIGRDAFARMKAGVVLINTSRGAIVDHEALLEALRSGKVGGCGLDVFVPEPLPVDAALRAMPHVVLTPHAAYYSEQAMADLRRNVVQNILDVLQGYYPASVVNTAILQQGRLRRRTGSN